MLDRRLFEKLKSKMVEHHHRFGYIYAPDREIIINEDLAKEYIDLVDKSLKDNFDYLPERYNIDVELRKRHTEGTID